MSNNPNDNDLSARTPGGNGGGARGGTGLFRSALLAIQILLILPLPFFWAITGYVSGYEPPVSLERMYYFTVIAAMVALGILRGPELIEKATQLIEQWRLYRAGQ